MLARITLVVLLLASAVRAEEPALARVEERVAAIQVSILALQRAVEENAKLAREQREADRRFVADREQGPVLVPEFRREQAFVRAELTSQRNDLQMLLTLFKAIGLLLSAGGLFVGFMKLRIKVHQE